jgi:hypothetical protein
MNAARWSLSIGISSSFLLITACSTARVGKRVSAEPQPAATPVRDAVRPSITERYRSGADRIVAATFAGNDAWAKMEALCDGIGHRLSGSPELDRAIHWAADAMRRDGQENVRLEKVMVPHWVRGGESIAMIEPREHRMPMLGLGGSVGTPAEGITGEVVVVADEAEFEARSAEMAGKIVLFNNAMPPYTPEGGTHYGQTVRFRGRGPVMAAEKGAAACLVRSVTAHSLQSPHTGATRYQDDVPQIPAAAITVEDAEMIARLTEGGQSVKVRLMMEARTLPDAESGNVIGELRGREKPDEVVVIGGHIDSWDVGQGAHDDGGGCVIAMEAINVLRKLGMVPRRTIRVVLFTNEENGLRGGRAYAEDHAGELADHVAAIESDSGVFKPTGYSVDCADEDREAIATSQMAEITSLLGAIGPLGARTGGSGADIGPMKGAGVVLMGHGVDSRHYFDYHHTHADTLDKVDPRELSENVAALATVAYVIADMEERIGTP